MNVRVHFNLHLKTWSIVAMEGEFKGKVIGHADTVTLSGCTFRVSEASRLKVIEKKTRSVHAWIVGVLAETTSTPVDAIEFTYNPFRAPTFTRRDTDEPILNASTVWFDGKKAFAAIG